MPLIIGIDCGLTVTKAVVFDERGRVLATARRPSQQLKPQARHVERDMDQLWQACAGVISESLAASGHPASEVAAVAATAHGDGVYLLDRAGRPNGPGILSLDSRAVEVVEGWEADGTSEAALHLTGQKPHASAPSALLAWMARHQPERLAATGHVLTCKDWLTFCLTGRIGTDRTEASTSFTDVKTQGYNPDIQRLFGLDLDLPEIAPCEAVVGDVTPQAARMTGLLPGTPVVAGLHDVTASALGIGGHAQGVIAVVAGTYSINETVTSTPRTDARWFCRNAIRPGEWHPMAISPASAANYDWFLDHFTLRGPDIHATLAPEIAAALARPSSAFFHPYLFGSPHGGRASAGFFGLHGWHDRGDMLRAVLEGIAFNHRLHVEALQEAFPSREIRLTGGISRNPRIAQLFADALGLPVTVTETEEAAAWGAALCAGAGAGLWPTPFDDPRDLGGKTYRPEQDLTRRYRLHADLVQALAPLWPRLEAEDV
ncbi:FGGY-family carbohydrate kinase [Stagnihabitans tardus]|uniref:Carbohydrate kinase n=1 Tax=Stagnihabitans tardus TaxID=2699202 RepID=A0AAE4YAK8_9RHOB|nr:FGGY-family carbohydrate kinase [Stagnihabitans tardus]NBZ87773.1 carbohydrate kinase [Stagnihabitans tardus]